MKDGTPAAMTPDTYLAEKDYKAAKASTRIHGYDLARAMAVFGMIFVNYYGILANDTSTIKGYETVITLIRGRAAALFVMLAGIGIALMAHRFFDSKNNIEKLKIQSRLFRRSLILLIMGIMFMQQWYADILHYYAAFLLIGALVMDFPRRRLWGLVAFVYSIAVLVYCLLEGDPDITLYIPQNNFFISTVNDLLINGYYAIFPWLVFLIIGFWIAKFKVFNSTRSILMVLVCSGIALLVSILIADHQPAFNPFSTSERVSLVSLLTELDVFPMTPLFTVTAVSSSFLVIIVSLYISRIAMLAKIIHPLLCTGKMTLTIYVVHILLGQAVQNIASHYWYDFDSATVIYMSFGACVLFTIFSTLWLKRFPNGPLEWVMRKGADSMKFDFFFITKKRPPDQLVKYPG